MAIPVRGRADYLELGDWNAVCFECGRKFKASELLRHWKGYFVCEKHWEPRQPQDFVRGVPDIQTPSWTQPMPADTFTGGVCTLAGISGIAGFAVAGCSHAGLVPSGIEESLSGWIP